MIGTETVRDMGEQTSSKRSTRWWLRQDEYSVVIQAPAEEIYALLADLPRMGDLSPECRRVEWVDGSTGAVEGARFVGHNQGGPAGLMKWSRRGHVVTAIPAREFAFATEEGGREGVEWRYLLEPTGEGIRVAVLDKSCHRVKGDVVVNELAEVGIQRRNAALFAIEAVFRGVKVRSHGITQRLQGFLAFVIGLAIGRGR